ncbi:MAG TPA: SBBP repeat-containing protein, partial [Pyrinomonadaceae bacterium]|nr:SBBP repeat-containing protein [Pyrinomonadaceae bacterium]
MRILAIALALIPFVGILALCDLQRSRDHAKGAQVTTKQATENLKHAARYGTKAANSSNAPLSTHSNESLQAAYGKLPILFEANAGQMDKRVKFSARGSGYSLFLTSTEAVFALKHLSRKIDSQSTVEQIASRFMPTIRRGTSQNHEERSIQNVVRMKLFGANQSTKITGIEELPSTYNYFLGNDPSKWRANISTYTKVKYESVYPGVDAIYYGNQGKLEFDFVVAPRASYEQVRLRYEGAKSVRIDKASGDLILTTIDGGELRQHKPVVYQEIAGQRRMVQGSYDFTRKNEIAFRIAEYDSNLPLIIDPSFVYSTYLGGGADDIGYGIATDSAGNVYITGRTHSTNFPTASAFRSTNSGLRDIFITKLNPTGTAIVYSTYIGGSGDDLGFAITVNSSGESYATGWTNSSNFPLANALQPFYGGGTTDSFLIRLNSTGNSLLTSTYAGGSGTDVGDGIALDTSRNIYGIGYTTSADLLTVNAVQPFNAGGFDAYLIELSASGSSLIFATYAGGSGDDYGNAIAVDSAGYIYAIGDTNSTNLPTSGALQAFNAGGFDAFLGKLTPSGASIVFSSYAGGNGDDSGRGIAVDGSGNIYAAGFTNSTNLQLIVNAIQPTKGAGYDAFIAKLNSTGSSIFYSTFLGGNGDDGSFALAVDMAGNAYLTGDTSSTNFPVVTPLFASNAGAQDAFITKLNPS